MPDRDYDVVLYGASGFVGRQSVRYFASREQPGGLRWAIAGRDRAKLEEVKRQLGALTAHVNVLVADSRDQAAVDALVSRSRVVLNTAGPFAKYAELIVDACVRWRTHYVDLSGETVWVRKLIDRYHDDAASAGTRIIPFSGFDSVPSDIGTYLMVRHVQEKLGKSCTSVKAYFQAYGGLNGGTIATKLNDIDSGSSSEAKDPFLLNPRGLYREEDVARHRDPERALYDQDLGTWVGPFFMSPINTRVVRRSAALYEQWGAPYGSDFAYQEYLKYTPPFAKTKAQGTTAALALFDWALQRPFFRRLVTPFLPKPGSGPSERTMENGWFCCELLARTEDGDRVHGVVRDRGDPGNRVTVKCLCESALGLVLDVSRLPGGVQRGGILTPATGLGEVLMERLRTAGMVIEIGEIV